MDDSSAHYTVGGGVIAVGGLTAVVSAPVWGGVLAVVGFGVLWRGVRLARAEAAHLLPAGRAQIIEDKWLPEVLEFGRLTGEFWDALRAEYGAYGVLGHPTMSDGFSERVAASLWPDERSESGEEWDAPPDKLPREVSSFFLADFVRRVHERGARSHDASRRELSNMARVWSTRASNAAGGEFEAWLAHNLGAASLSTVKLLWYIEEALAKSIRNDRPDYEPYRFLRRVLMREG